MLAFKIFLETISSRALRLVAQSVQYHLIVSVPFGKDYCSEVQSNCSTPSKRPTYHEREKTEIGPSSKQSSQEQTPSLPLMTSPLGFILKVFNNEYSHAFCFYSRRLRPQTPQGSDDEGGKSTLANPHSVSLLTGKEEPSTASPAHLSCGSRADKQAVRSLLLPSLRGSSVKARVPSLPLTTNCVTAHKQAFLINTSMFIK